MRAVRRLVALEEERPVRRRDLRARLAHERHAGFEQPPSLLLDLLALVVIERGEKIGEVLVVAVAPVELQAVANQHAGSGAFARLVLVGEQHVERGEAVLQFAERALEQCAARRRIVADEARSRHRRERNRSDELRIVATSVAPIRIGPAPVEYVLAVAVRLRVERHRADQLAWSHAVRKRGVQPVSGAAQRVRCSAEKYSCDNSGSCPQAGSSRAQRSATARRRRESAAKRRPAVAAGNTERVHAWTRLSRRATMLDAARSTGCRVLTFLDADRDGAAEPEARRPRRQCARIARRYR